MAIPAVASGWDSCQHLCLSSVFLCEWREGRWRYDKDLLGRATWLGVPKRLIPDAFWMRLHSIAHRSALIPLRQQHGWDTHRRGVVCVCVCVFPPSILMFHYEAPFGKHDAGEFCVTWFCDVWFVVKILSVFLALAKTSTVMTHSFQSDSLLWCVYV